MSKTRIRLPASTIRVAVALVISLGLLATAPLAQASDASLKRALKPYKTRLTTDITYLSTFSVPSKKAASTLLRRLSKIRTDLAGATRAATNNQGSTKSGRKGRTLVLTGLRDASTAAADATACATAVRSGKGSAAKHDQRNERSEVNKAISPLESGGKLLGLF